MTLIEVRNSDGVVGRCDERCYAARHPDCDCVCHGRNHGVGLHQAIDNTREMGGQLLAEYRQDGQAAELADRVLGQIPLFQE
jgi:hypothetical protein